TWTKDSKQLQLILERKEGSLEIAAGDLKPCDIADAGLVKKVMDASQDDFLKRHKGSKLLSQTDLNFMSKYPMRECQLELSDGRIYRKQVVLTPTYMYVIGVTGTKEYSRSAEVQKFLDSFRIEQWVRIADHGTKFECEFPTDPDKKIWEKDQKMLNLSLK